MHLLFFFFQAEDGIRDFCLSRGLGDVYKRQMFLISALFNPFLYFLGENFGLKNSSATISAVIIATIPVFSPIAAFFFLKERLSMLNIGGMVISFAGVLVMLVNKDLSLNAAPLGLVCLGFAVVAAIVYSM